MVQSKRQLFLLTLLAGSGVTLAGCSRKPAWPTKNDRSASRALASPAVPNQARQVSKPAPRESALAVYSNPEYGVMFRYPRNYALEEAAFDEEKPDDIPGVRSQEELAREQPGTRLVATVVVPDDAYPNTTFAGGSLQFAVNPSLEPEACREFLISRLGDSKGPRGKATIQGVAFAWAENSMGDDANTEFFERDYAGFSNGTCYEFFLRVGVGRAADEDGVKAADEQRILGHLEKIVSSVQTQPKPVSVLDQ
jgi:hypothetical protein